MIHAATYTAAAAAAELFFDGKATSVPHSPAKQLKIHNTDFAETMQISFDQAVTWVDIDPGKEVEFAPGGDAVLSNSRQSFLHKRKNAADVIFKVICIADPTRVR